MVHSRSVKAACLPYPLCVRALAYMMIVDDEDLHFEFVVKDEFGIYCSEYDKEVAPLARADQNHLRGLFAKYNKKVEIIDTLFE